MEYLMWLDADDVLPGGSLDKLRNLKETLCEDTDVVMMPYVVAFEKDGSPAFSYYRETDCEERMRIFLRGKSP